MREQKPESGEEMREQKPYNGRGNERTKAGKW